MPYISETSARRILQEAADYLADRKPETERSWKERNRVVPDNSDDAIKLLQRELVLSKNELAAELVDDPEWTREWINDVDNAIDYFEHNEMWD